MKHLLLSILSIAIFFTANAQIYTTSNNNGNQLAQMIAGNGVTVSNVTLTCANGAAGSFTCGNCNLPMQAGIMLTTGQIANVVGPNNFGSVSSNNNTPGDADLDTVLNYNVLWFEPRETTYDACKLEFDFIPITDSISIEFSLGSEEYLEWVDANFNDVAAILISGPGITGKENIALIPNTNTAVSIDNVNNISNAQYYLDNGNGFTAPYDSLPYYIHYDGLTTNIIAKKHNLQALQTYHLKLGIADAGDEVNDSGLFIKGHSLNSGSNTMNYAPIAEDDYYTTYQTDTSYFNVGLNDADLNTDSLCVTAVWGSALATTVNSDSCAWILYTASAALGNDTAYYTICDNGTPALCDTAMIVFTVLQNTRLLPAANFTLVEQTGCAQATFSNTSQNATGTAQWSFNSLAHTYAQSATGDTVTYTNLVPGGYDEVEITLTVSNTFGSTSFTDTLTFICESINEISLFNIYLYPNPAGNVLTIDMSKHKEGITNNYTAIEIYNVLGQQVAGTKNTGQVAQLEVSNLLSGMYMASLVDNTGTRHLLGRFTKQ